MSVDYFTGPQFDNGGNYNSALLARDVSATHHAGFYCAKGSAGTTAGPWAPQFIVFDEAGTAVKNAAQGYIFADEPGFDNLPMEQWHRMGVVVDWDTREILQIKSQELFIGGEIWVIDNPTGPNGEALYASTADPAVIYYVRLYDVGSGTLTAFDNLYVGDPYEWQVVVPEPATLSLLTLGGLALVRRRKRGCANNLNSEAGYLLNSTTPNIWG